MGLPTGTSPEPIQSQHPVTGTPQPGLDFFRLKRVLSRTKLAIKQLRDFFGRAWLPDLVQPSKDTLVEAAVCIWNLTHFRLSG